MSFLILNTDYPQFLRWLYVLRLGLGKQPYAEQMWVESLFGAAKRRMDMILGTVDTTEDLVKKAKGTNGEEKKIAELYLKRLQSVKGVHRFAEEMMKNIFRSE